MLINAAGEQKFASCQRSGQIEIRLYLQDKFYERAAVTSLN